MRKKDFLQILGMLIVGISLALYLSYRDIRVSTTNPQFTVGEIIGTKDIGQSDYIIFKYKKNNDTYIGEQGLSKRKKTIKGTKYLLVYNKKKHRKNLLIYIEVKDSLGSDLNYRYSVKELKKEGYISIFY